MAKYLTLYPGLEVHTGWAFIVDGDLDYDNNEHHRWGVRVGAFNFWCAGCLAEPGPDGFPSMSRAPNGLRLVLRYLRADDHVARRAECPVGVAGSPDGCLRTEAEAMDVHHNIEQIESGWDCDDMLTWLQRRCSTIRIDPIRTHEVGYTLECTDNVRSNQIIASVSAATLHAALKLAIQSVDLLDEARQQFEAGGSIKRSDAVVWGEGGRNGSVGGSRSPDVT